MKNIIKSLIVMLASVSLFGSAYAGSLGVSGTAKQLTTLLLVTILAKVKV